MGRGAPRAPPVPFARATPENPRSQVRLHQHHVDLVSADARLVETLEFGEALRRRQAAVQVHLPLAAQPAVLEADRAAVTAPGAALLALEGQTVTGEARG